MPVIHAAISRRVKSRGLGRGVCPADSIFAEKRQLDSDCCKY